MVVNDGLPLRFFSGENFTAMCGEIARKHNIGLSRDRIREYVLEEAAQQKKILREQIKDQFVYIKLDVATRIRVNYLGINVRYVDKETLLPVTKTLAVKDTFDQHSSDALRKMLSDTLDDYGIELKNVVSIVSDNAANMVKMVRDMIVNPVIGSSDSETDDENSNATDIPDEDDQVHELHDTSGEEESSSTEDQQHDDDDLMLQAGVMQLLLQHMRCVAHTLQLAINDGLKSGAARDLIALVRNVSKEARRIARVFRERGCKTALIDQDTRWCSIYLMVERLIELKDCVKELANCGNRKLEIRDSKWQEIEQLCAILKKPYDLTIRVQNEDLTAGVFYRLDLYFFNNRIKALKICIICSPQI